MSCQRADLPAHLKDSNAARRFFEACFEGMDDLRERLWVAHLDSSVRCIHLEGYDGNPSSVGMPVRAIMADAVRLASVGLIVAHNHPGGNPEPSHADCLATRHLAQAGRALRIVLLDHLIFGADNICLSMRRRGLI